MSQAHLAAAADWFVRLSSPEASEADQAGWQAWYDQAPEHRGAWQRVERLKGLLASTPSEATPALLQPRRLHRRGMLAGLGVVAMGAVLYRTLPWLHPSATTDWVETVAGQRREIVLPDGGRLLLAPDSRVGIRYENDVRRLELAHGALQLDTGRDERGRPLRIHLRDGVITPLGTRLTLAQDDQGSVVAVQAHAVEVRTISQPERALRVDAGQRLRFTRASAGAIEPAGFADEAWTHGVLMAMDQPLERFLREFQRQSGVLVSCDPALAGRMRVSGAFLVTEAQRSLSTLAEQQGLRLERRGQGWHLSAG